MHQGKEYLCEVEMNRKNIASQFHGHCNSNPLGPQNKDAALQTLLTGVKLRLRRRLVMRYLKRKVCLASIKTYRMAMI